MLGMRERLNVDLRCVGRFVYTYKMMVEEPASQGLHFAAIERLLDDVTNISRTEYDEAREALLASNPSLTVSQLNQGNLERPSRIKMYAWASRDYADEAEGWSSLNALAKRLHFLVKANFIQCSPRVKSSVCRLFELPPPPLRNDSNHYHALAVSHWTALCLEAPASVRNVMALTTSVRLRLMLCLVILERTQRRVLTSSIGQQFDHNDPAMGTLISHPAPAELPSPHVVGEHVVDLDPLVDYMTDTMTGDRCIDQSMIDATVQWYCSQARGNGIRQTYLETSAILRWDDSTFGDLRQLFWSMFNSDSVFGSIALLVAIVAIFAWNAYSR